MLELEGQIKMEEKKSVNEKVCESDFVPLWDGTVMCRSLAERKLLEGIYVWSNEFR